MKINNLKILSKSADLLNYIVSLLIMIACIYPFYYVIIYSFSDPNKAQMGLFLLPAGFSIDTYKTIFLLNDIPLAFLVSVSRTVLATIMTLVCSSFFAYLVTHRNMRYRSFTYRIVIITMYINAGLIPWYLTMKAYGLQNNFLLYILPGAVIPFYLILIKTFMEQLPQALNESAKIDGAGIIKIFWRIIMPLSKPILATVGLYSIVGQWNAWIDNYFLITNPRLQTLQMVLYNYLNQANRLQNMASGSLDASAAVSMVTPTSVKMCITVIVIVPILFVYPFLQKYFAKGIMMGAVKG